MMQMSIAGICSGFTSHTSLIFNHTITQHTPTPSRNLVIVHQSLRALFQYLMQAYDTCHTSWKTRQQLDEHALQTLPPTLAGTYDKTL